MKWPLDILPFKRSTWRKILQKCKICYPSQLYNQIQPHAIFLWRVSQVLNVIFATRERFLLHEYMGSLEMSDDDLL